MTHHICTNFLEHLVEKGNCCYLKISGAGYSSTTKPTTTTTNNQQLNAAALVQGQKFAKYAVSALTYEDVPTAVDNLEKALRVLTTGQCMTE